MCYTILKSEVVMKKLKSRTISAIISVFILLASLTVMLLDIFVPWRFWTHPILNFLFCLFAGFGVLNFVLAIMKKSPAYFFLSALLICPASFYVTMQYIIWWVALVILVVTVMIFPVISIIVCGNKTEDIALNKSEDYKNYEQRKAEKEAEEAAKEPEPLPEIKSFK